MIPTILSAISSNYVTYFEQQYPSASDCETVKNHIEQIEKDIVDLKNYKTPIQNSFSLPNNNLLNLKFKNTNLILEIQTKNKVQEYLNKLLLSKKQVYELSNCKNQQNINLTQQNNTQNINTPSKTSESRTKQYVLIGLGSLLVLTTVIFVAIKKK